MNIIRLITTDLLSGITTDPGFVLAPSVTAQYEIFFILTAVDCNL